eukprot:CAMPEP_0198727716 /NCGR_PEP_ID=MMETSP1475-20131203/4869_1 /TAXON_ID= ORGANISM="Unidentified sp., Strain CCMP1999" /NCGR_SAMPLE_ID=MMETSP1475 /ASSEMBLY_ACC=CAM_ASM_001111 /LENGTH=200 /DNA_ID=CAMNT_0044489831 /DNA_START=51 /DNA_END=653 /DNA_ORIENTATION=-
MGIWIAPKFVAEYIPARSVSPLRAEGWWLNRWPFLGWLETFVKGAAWYYAARTPQRGGLWGGSLSTVRLEPSASYRYEVYIMLLLTGLLIAAIGDRIFYREIISMCFVFPQMYSHVVVTGAMLRGRAAISVRDFRIFIWLQFIGDLVKLLFFIVHDFNIKKVARWVLYTLVTLFFVMYAIVLLLDYNTFGVLTRYKHVPT